MRRLCLGSRSLLPACSLSLWHAATQCYMIPSKALPAASTDARRGMHTLTTELPANKLALRAHSAGEQLGACSLQRVHVATKDGSGWL